VLFEHNPQTFILRNEIDFELPPWQAYADTCVCGPSVFGLISLSFAFNMVDISFDFLSVNVTCPLPIPLFSFPSLLVVVSGTMDDVYPQSPPEIVHVYQSLCPKEITPIYELSPCP
jgi:hypothetical protein